MQTIYNLYHHSTQNFSVQSCKKHFLQDHQKLKKKRKLISQIMEKVGEIIHAEVLY